MNSLCATPESSPPGSDPPVLPATSQPDPATHRAKQDARTVLIADDDRDLVNILSVRCRRKGHKVLAAHDAFTALALIRSKLPDVICLDVEMPAGNGLSVCEMLSTDEAYREIPVVILTGKCDPDTIIRCHTLCAYYVEKCPDIWNRLEPLLNELFSAPEAAPAIALPVASATNAALAPAVQAALPAPAVQAALPAPPTEEVRPEAPITFAPAIPLEAAQAATTPVQPPPAPAPQKEETVTVQGEPIEDRSESPNAENCRPATEVATEAPAAPDSVWRHLTQVVGRVVGRTAGADEQETLTETPAAAEPLIVRIDKAGEADRGAKATASSEGTLDDKAQPRPTAVAAAAPIPDLDKAWTMFGSQSPAPPARPARADKKEERSAPEKTGAAEKIILIADDDGDLVQMIALRCSQLGLRVFRSPDAMHALLGVHRVRPDLVLLDVNMPGGNGLSICEMLTGEESLSKIPVIVMTGDSNDEIPRRCQAMRAQFLVKGAGLWERLEPLIRRSLGLPVLAGDSAPSKPAEAGTDKRRPRILCIDDDPDISKILKIRLESFGVDVLRAFNGMQGYWTALDMRPDLIILDMVMPDGAGNYIFGRLRSHPLTEKVPVLMLTGVNTPGVRRQMFGLGVDAYLTKPLDFNALLDHVRQYVPIVPLDKSAAPHPSEADRPREEREEELVTAGRAAN